MLEENTNGVSMCKKIDHINTNKVAVVVTLSIFNWLVLNLTTWYYTRNNCTISSKLTANLLNFTFSNVVRQQRHLPIKLCYFNAPGFYFIRYVDRILFIKILFSSDYASVTELWREKTWPEEFPRKTDFALSRRLLSNNWGIEMLHINDLIRSFWQEKKTLLAGIRT